MVKYFIQIVFILFSCETLNATSGDTTKPVLKAIEVQDSNPIFGASFYRIFYIDSFIVYQSQYQYDSSMQGINFDSKSEKRDRFFVFHKDSSYGYIYDPHLSAENNQRQPVDSTLQKIKGSNNFEGLLAKKPDTAIWNAQKTELKEVYVQKASGDTPEVHLNFYYSSRLNHLNASLNSVMDSARKMKFYKFEYLVKSFYSEKEQRHWPDTKISAELKEITVTNPEEIMQYIDRYKNNMLEKKQAGSTKKSME